MASGDEGIRTPDPLLARQVLSQLSYTPRFLGFIRFLTLGSHPILFYIFCLIYVAYKSLNKRTRRFISGLKWTFPHFLTPILIYVLLSF